MNQPLSNALAVSPTNAKKLIVAGRELQEDDADVVLGLALDALAEKLVKRKKVALNEKAQTEWREQADDDMLFPTSFDESNVVFGPPAGMTEEEIFSLSAARIDWDGQPAILSCWKPNIEQLKKISEKGRVWIATMGNTLAPLCVCADNPINKPYVKVKEE